MTTKRSDRTSELLRRLWREHLIHHKPRLALVLALTLLMAGTTALYPVVINHAFDMFTQHDRRILYQIPALVVVVTGVKALAQYFQNVQVQQVVLLVIRELQGRMFAHLTRADLARLEREAPAQLAAHFTTDAATIREALTRAVNGVADVVTVIGLVGSMIYLNWLLSLIAAAMYPLAIMPIERIGKRVRKASGGMQERVGETAALLNEILRPGPHGPRLSPGSQRNPPRRGRLPAALQIPAADDQKPLPRRAGAGGAGWRRRRRGHRLRGLARRRQRPRAGRFHRLRRRPADRRPAAARAGIVERGVAGRAGGAGAGLRHHRRAADHQGRPERRRRCPPAAATWCSTTSASSIPTAAPAWPA